MSALVLTTEQATAIRRALRYWVERWDWESPTLFGLSKPEFSAAIDAEISPEHSVGAYRLASLGALRELLHGANAAKAGSLPSILGLSRSEAVSLMAAVSKQVDGEI